MTCPKAIKARGGAQRVVPCSDSIVQPDMTIRSRIKRIAPKWAIAAWNNPRFFDWMLPDRVVILRDYWRARGQLPNLRRPQTFTDKVTHRMLYDRRDILTVMTDKYRVRDYVASRLGPSVLPQLYHVTTNPETIPFGDLPDRFVVKPTCGSGRVYLVPDRAALDTDELIATCRSWLAEDFYGIYREWPYRNVPRRIIIEEFIDDGSGKTPNDYKFFVYDGRARFIQVDKSRFDGHRRRMFATPWQRLECTYDLPDIEGDVPRPKHLDEMIAAAELLGANIEFVRADFYDTGSKLFFGELTTTPGAGRLLFDPPEYDLLYGVPWTLPAR